MNDTFNAQDVKENKTVAVIMAVIPVLFFIPFLGANTQSSPYLRFRANQTLVYFVFAAIIGIVRGVLNVLAIIPLVGLLAMLVNGIIGFIIGAYWLIGLISAITEVDKGKKYPIIGEITLIK